MPEDAKFNFPGDLLAVAIKSATELMPRLGLTAKMMGALDTKVMGTSVLTVCVMPGFIAGFTEMLLGLASKMV